MSASSKLAISSNFRSALMVTPCDVSTHSVPVTLTVLMSTPPLRRMSTGANPSISSKPLARNSYTLAIIYLFFVLLFK
ncbi:Uncharacterised protein [Segatella copri]|nr:Uncharacterised protein [Segatella copri]